MTAKAIRHKDVYGKEIQYIELEHNGEKRLIRSGESTLQWMEDVQKQREIPFNEPDKEPTKKIKEPKL